MGWFAVPTPQSIIRPMPEIAKSWEWSSDGKQLTMHLIEGAKWSDGVPFTAFRMPFIG